MSSVVAEDEVQDVEDWKIIAERKQHELNAVLGSRKWDGIKKNDLFLLKKKIGFAACGDAKEEATSDNYYTGYGSDDIEMIKRISNQIIITSDCDPIKFACTFLIVYWDNAMSSIPVFRIVNSEGNVFIDTNGRVYNNWESFMVNNQLPKCGYCYPVNGEYNSESKLELLFTESPACNFINQATDYLDIAASATAVGATLGSIFVSAPVLVPVIGVASAYHAVRSAHTLYDRSSHQQSIGLGDREARNAWLNIAGSAVAAGTAAAVGKAKKVVEGGKQLSKLSVFGVKVLNTSSLVFNGFGFVDNILLCKEKYMSGTLTPLDVFNLSCEVLFFYNAVASVQATSNMLNQMTQVNIAEGSASKVKLTRTQKRNLRKKMSRQKAKLAQMNLRAENLNSSTGEGFLTGIAANVFYKIIRGYNPSVEEMLYPYQCIGHDIRCWMNNEITFSELIKSICKQMIDLYEQLMEDLRYMMDIIGSLKYKVEEYFSEASPEQKTKFCISVKNLDNKIESVISKTNEEVAGFSDSERIDYSEQDQTDTGSENSIDNEGLPLETQGLLNKIDKSIVSNFKCESLEDYQYIVESVEEVFIENFSDTYEQYKTALNAAKAASTDFDLILFNEKYGIKGEPGQYFYNAALNSIDCKKLIRKIKNVHEKKRCEQSEDTNILEGRGKMYNFYGLKGEGKMSKEEIFLMIASKMKLNNLCSESVKYFEENGSPIMFIYPKEDAKTEIKGIAVYYELNEENTTVGFFNVYQ